MKKKALYFIAILALGVLVSSSSNGLVTGPDTPKCIAVILTGDPTHELVFAQFHETSMSFYNTLIKYYGYTDDSIILFEHKGNGSKEVDFNAEKGTVIRELSKLARLKAKDKLVIFIQGMGRIIKGEIYLRLPGSGGWEEENNKLNLSGEELGELMGAIKAKKIILIETCNGKGWIKPLQGTNSVVAVSCDSNQYSYGQFSGSLVAELKKGSPRRSIKEIYEATRRQNEEALRQNRYLRNIFGTPPRFSYSSDPANDGLSIARGPS